MSALLRFAWGAATATGESCLRLLLDEGGQTGSTPQLWKMNLNGFNTQ
jgi:hypothetical protein